MIEKWAMGIPSVVEDLHFAHFYICVFALTLNHTASAIIRCASSEVRDSEAQTDDDGIYPCKVKFKRTEL